VAANDIMKAPHPLNHKAGRLIAIHRDIKDSVYEFQREMLRLEAQVPAFTFKPGPVSPEMMHFVETKKRSQTYSRVVQVFAFLAVEAFMNEYGYLRLGEEAFEHKFKKQIPIAQKLKSIIGEVFGRFSNENTEIIDIVTSLAARRNRLVHPKPEMEVWLADGTKRRTTKRLPPVDARSAQSAVQEMERFFALFATIDPEAAFVLGCAPQRAPSGSLHGEL
jgi:hypothetical protein